MTLEGLSPPRTGAGGLDTLSSIKKIRRTSDVRKLSDNQKIQKGLDNVKIKKKLIHPPS